MPKTDEPPMVKKNLRLYIGDFEALGELYPEVGGSKAVRLIIRNHLRKCEERALEQESSNDRPPEIAL